MEVVHEPLVVKELRGVPGVAPATGPAARAPPRQQPVCPHAHPHLAPGAADVAGGPPAGLAGR